MKIRHDALPHCQYVFGKTFIEHIDPSNPERHPLKIGTDTFSSIDIATMLQCTNLLAARRLSALADAIGAKNVRDFYQRSTPYSMATSTEGIGVTTLFVAWRLFEARGLDPHEWYRRGQKEAVVSFSYFKGREQKHAKIARRSERKHRAHTGNAKPAVAHDRAKRRTA